MIDFKVRSSKKSNILVCFVCILYLLISTIVFNFVVEPGLSGKTDIRFWADSVMYINSIQKNNISFNEFELFNTFIGPFIVFKLLNDHLLIFLFNLLLLFVSYLLFSGISNVNQLKLLLLMLTCPWTIVSTVSLNKEIFLLMSTACYSIYLSNSKKYSYLLLAIAIGIMARTNLSVIMIFFACLLYLVNSKNHLLKRRWLILSLIILLASAFYPFIYKFILDQDSLGQERIENLFYEQSSGGLTLALSELQNRGLLVLTILPKAILNLYGNIVGILPLFLNTSQNIDLTNIIQTFVLPIHSLMCLIISIISFRCIKNKKVIENNNFYFSVFCILVYSISPFVEPRYMLSAYFLTCVELSKENCHRFMPTQNY